MQNLVRLDDPGEAKVGQLEHSIVVWRGVQQILGLEVSMHNPMVVAIVNRAQNLKRCHSCLHFGVVLFGNDAVKHFSPRHAGHDNMTEPGTVEDLMYLDNVGVVEFLDNEHLRF